MANLTCAPGAASFIHDDQALLTGTGDSIPATSALYIAIGTAPGGPYTTFLGPAFPGVQGDGSIGQSVTNIFTGLAPSTQYYFRTEERDFATGGTVINAGSECTFTTAASSNYIDDCFLGASGVGNRNSLDIGTTFDDLPISHVNQLRFEHGLTALGPWTADPFIRDAGAVAQVGQPVNASLASNPYTFDWTLDANTPYFLRIVLIRDGVDAEFKVCGPFTTLKYPTFICENGISTINVNATDADIQVSVQDGDQRFNNDDTNVDTITINWGTSPGVYTDTTGPLPVTSDIINTFNVSPLSPSTAYYFQVVATEVFQSAGDYYTSPECSFTTPGAFNLVCNPATAIAGSTATVSGQGDNVGTVERIMIRFGTTPGGPYPDIFGLSVGGTPAVAFGNNTTPQVISGTAVNLTPSTTYYYRTEVVDDQFDVIEAGPECSFTTTAATQSTVADPPANITATSADGNGTLNGAVLGNVYEFVLGPSGGPFTDVRCPDTPVSGADPQAVTCNFTGLTTGQQYCYVVRLKDAPGGNILASSPTQQCFTPVAAPPTPAVNATPATAVTQTTADSNGTADNIPVNEFVRIAVGPTGGPYTDLGPNVAGTNAVGQPITRPLAGLTPNTQYCYVVQHLATDGTTVLQTSPTEECFTTAAAPVVSATCNDSETNITQTTADLAGTGDNVVAPSYMRIEVGTTPGGPYTTYNQFPTTPGNNTVGQPVSTTATGLTAGTLYYWRVAVYDGSDVFVTASADCSFTTAAPVVVPLVLSDPPDQTDPTPGDLGQLCTQFTASTLTNTRTFVFTPPTQNGCAPTVTQVGLAPCQPLAPTEPNGKVNFTTVPNVPQPIYHPTSNPGAFRLLFSKPIGPICSYEFTLTDGMANSQSQWAFYIQNPAGGPPFFLGGTGPDVVGNMGFTTNQIVTPGATGTASYGPGNVTFTFVSGGPGAQLHMKPGSGEFFSRNPGDPDVPVTIRMDFDPPISDLQLVGAIGANNFAAGKGVTDNMIAAAPVATYQACCTPSGPGTFCYDIQETDSFDGNTSPVQNFCFTWTPPLPVGIVTDPPTGITDDCITFHGTSTNVPPGCTYGFVYGTTPGGPYPFSTGAIPPASTGASPEAFSQTVCGLNPSTQYYYKAQVQCGVNPPVQGNEQTGTTLATPLIDPCEAPTNLTSTSVTLNASSQNVPAGYSYRFRYGTVPGGPYGGVISGGPSSGGTPDPYSANVAGLTPFTTYYYISEALDPGNVVVATSPVECSFTTLAILSPIGFYYCGKFYPVGTPAIFVGLKDGSYQGGYWRPVPLP